jgi:hypothetical protein
MSHLPGTTDPVQVDVTAGAPNGFSSQPAALRHILVFALPFVITFIRF